MMRMQKKMTMMQKRRSIMVISIMLISIMLILYPVQTRMEMTRIKVARMHVWKKIYPHSSQKDP